MYTKIKKITSIPAGEHIILLVTPDSKLTGTGLSEEEISFVKKEFKDERNTVAVNQYNRWIIVQQLKTNGVQGLEKARKAGDQVLNLVNRNKIKQVTIANAGVSSAEVLAFTEGLVLGNYQFIKYKKEAKKETNTLRTVAINDNSVTKADIDELETLCDAVCIARDLVNEPVSHLNAVQLSKEFQKLGKEAGFHVTVYDKNKISDLKMGGLLAVNLGSVDPPTFTVMEWKPSGAVNKKPYVLIGKGVVYDTGGLSLKPTPNSMDSMKCDMAGSAVVACTMYAIARQKLPLHVVALVPATDNRPGGNAYVPGDVIHMHSGQTVEMLNADAEGRIILADALSYAKKLNPELVMDFATLTGAAAAAIGQYGIVCMGTADDKIKAQLQIAGNEVYERLVEFPLWDEYDELIKSDIADMKNIGGPYGGAITAGKFLQRFIDYPWMHFDIAGPAFLKSDDSYRGKNGSGVGVRLMFNFLKRRLGK